MSEPAAASGPEAAIEVIQLTRRFGEMVALNKLTLSVPGGSIFGLLGPNGAGKSTLIKMLTTLLPPTSGTALVAGLDIVRQPRQVRRHIGYVSQMLSADGDLTGYENLLISAELYGLTRTERNERITQALNFMVLLTVSLGASVFSTFSLIAACIVKSRERFMGIGQVLTMPLFFASNAIYPLEMMPTWLRWLSRVNPLTYQVDALRGLMIEGGHSGFGLGLDLLVQGLILTILVAIAAKLYPNIVT